MTIILAVITVGCASGRPLETQIGPPDAALEARALELTRQPLPLHVIFDWRLVEREDRFGGRGVTRFEPPDKARLDLFGPKDEQYLSAAVVGAELRLPPGEDGVQLPPPALFWGALGVFRPPAGARLVGSARDSVNIRLDYERGEEHWTFLIADDRLRSIEWLSPDGQRTMQLETGGSNGLPRETVYRDAREFIELTMTLDTVIHTDGFDADIWIIRRRP